MTLQPGTRLGPYEIVAPLGAGGMGEVYRAKDTRLGREVAVKVLPGHLSVNAELRARFEREARTVSSLNHPHICTLFDVGREGETDFLVMELVEGETLAQRLARGALPGAEVIRLGIQIADALERAHRAGVIHRDLKPGNVMLARGGAKLMDFGLARAAGLPGPGGGATPGDRSSSPTLAQPLTAEGTIVGTFQYMAPEQLEGREADARSDLWALGCLLYEMATGRRAFEGRSQASLISAIMSGEPAPIAASTPVPGGANPMLVALDRLVRALLAKDPGERIQTAHDARLQLQWIGEGGSQGGAPAPVALPRRRVPVLAIALGALGLVAGAAGALLLARAPAPARVMRVSVLPPEGAILDDDQAHLAVSPDGTMLVFVATDSSGTSQLWLRELASTDPRPLANTQDAIIPFWSPDSRFIGFFAGGRLKKTDVAGRTVQVVCDAPDGRGGAWSRRGFIVFAPASNGPLLRVRESGGPVTPATALDTTRGESAHRFPSFLADGERFVYVSLGDSIESRIGLPGGSSRPLELTAFGGAVWAPGDLLLFAREGALMVQRLDAARGRMRGEPHVLGFAPATSRYAGAPPASVSANGVLVQRRRMQNTADLVWLDRSGRPTGRVPTAPGAFFDLALSPDADRAALVRVALGNQADVWNIQLATGLAARLTVDQVLCEKPVWSPDGRWIAYTALARSKRFLYRRPSNGAGQPERLSATGSGFLDAACWSKDGRELLVRDLDPGTGEDLWKLEIGADSTLQPVLRSRFHEEDARLSPDGRWLAYRSNESGRPELYVQSYPTSEARIRVSRDGAGSQSRSIFGRPYWRADGRELVYVGGDGLSVLSVPVEYDGTPRFGPARTLFQIPRGCYDMDATADLQRFLVLQQRSSGEDASIQMLVNWPAELKER